MERNLTVWRKIGKQNKVIKSEEFIVNLLFYQHFVLS